jgi:hypothetical protein
VPRRAAALRLPTRRCRSAPQPSTRPPRHPTPPARTRPGHGTARDLDLRPTPRWSQHREHRPPAQRTRRSGPVLCRSRAQPAPCRARLVAAHGHRDPAQPPVHRVSVPMYPWCQRIDSPRVRAAVACVS